MIWVNAIEEAGCSQYSSAGEATRLEVEMVVPQLKSRREFIIGTGVAMAWPPVVRAQQERIRRVGVLTPFTDQDGIERDDVVAFTQDFQRLGWQEGQNFHLEYRAVGPNVQRLQSAAADLVHLKPEVIFVVGSAALRAVQANTDTIPIVFVGVTAPVGQGLVTAHRDLDL